MKKVLLMVFAVALLIGIGVSARAAGTAEVIYPGILPGSFLWNIKMFGEDVYQEFLGVFNKQAEANYVEQRLNERNQELTEIAGLLKGNSETFLTTSNLQGLQHAYDVAAASQLSDLNTLGSLENNQSGANKSTLSSFTNPVAEVVTGLPTWSLATQEVSLQNRIAQDQNNGDAADLLLARTNLNAIQQAMAQNDASYFSEQTALNLATENVGPVTCFVNGVKTAACWVSEFQADEQKVLDNYDGRDITPNANVNALKQQMDALLAQAQQDIQAGNTDKANMLVPQMGQLMQRIWLGLQQQFEDNDTTQAEAENQEQPSQTIAQPAPKPKLKTIPSETIAQSPLGLLEIGTVLQGQVNVPFTKTFIAGGGLPPYRYQLDTGVGFPPQGIMLAPSGVLSGTPSIPGDYTFGVCVVDTSGKSDCEKWEMTVTPVTTLPAPAPVPAPTPQYSLTGSGSCAPCLYGGSDQCTTASGDASGPVGAQLYLEQDLTLNCGSWTQNNSGCERDDGQPAGTSWNVPPNTNGGVEIDIGTNNSEVGAKRLSFGPCY